MSEAPAPIPVVENVEAPAHTVESTYNQISRMGKNIGMLAIQRPGLANDDWLSHDSKFKNKELNVEHLSQREAIGKTDKNGTLQPRLSLTLQKPDGGTISFEDSLAAAKVTLEHDSPRTGTSVSFEKSMSTKGEAQNIYEALVKESKEVPEANTTDEATTVTVTPAEKRSNYDSNAKSKEHLTADEALKASRRSSAKMMWKLHKASQRAHAQREADYQVELDTARADTPRILKSVEDDI